MDRLSEWIDAFRAAAKDGDPLRPDPRGMPELIGFLEELRAARAELGTARRELRQLRDALDEPEHYQLGGVWSDDGPAPADYVLLDSDGNPVEVDALEVRGDLLVQAVVERHAAVLVRAAEMAPAVPLEQLLEMVGPGWDLVADSDSERGRRPQYHAGWFRGGAATGRKLEEHHGEGANCASAIRAATIALLRGRQRCGTCAHWGAEDETGKVRSCRTDEDLLSYTAESSCSDGWAPAQWLKDGPEQLPTSPARLVRAALAWADEIGRLGNLHYTTVEQELFAAANELRGTEPERGDDGPTESQISRARRVAADTAGTPWSVRRLAVAWLAQHGLGLSDGEGGQ